MRIIVFILLTVLMSSCVGGTTIVRDTPTSIPATDVIHFTYDSHEYILFRDRNFTGVSGYVHNPNCKYCKKL